MIFDKETTILLILRLFIKFYFYINMRRKIIYLIFALSLCTSAMYAQLGIKAGVNMANEIKSFSRQDIQDGFRSSNLTGFQIGLVYQAMPKNSGMGVEIGALLSQKGSAFSDSTNIIDAIKQGYKELNYLEVPLNLRYRLSLGFLGIYGSAGIYGSYALSGITVNEISNSRQNESYPGFMDRMDFGYNLGIGIELFKKIQLGGTWSEGLKNTANSNMYLPLPTTATNRVFTVNLVYLF